LTGERQCDCSGWAERRRLIGLTADADKSGLDRYQRQTAFAPLGVKGQVAISSGRALIVGLGGLGTWTAELLARAGVGFLRLVDADKVDLTNIHRQGLYDEADAAAGALKVHAAAARIKRVNSAVAVETAVERLGADNIEKLAGDVAIILDGTDNFQTRFVINDYAVKTGRPWILAGVIGAEAQTMTIVPGRTPCLRCVYEFPAPVCVEPTCRRAGVLGPAVAAIAAIQAMEAIKVLSGRLEAINPFLLKMDLWTGTLQRIDVSVAAANAACPCCKHRRFEFLLEAKNSR
jgi:adenylyltransferase/sulfurtransferase